ncbi:hypothetical protein MNBD_GAMMA22-2753 [hydrothermal vent metagenome]|uniref:DUF4124 domain-containing protein n=1 Tax=hydrothermal vent metagenome TaxID=652676 RepID=A0A3B1AFU7_9ZZZZ
MKTSLYIIIIFVAVTIATYYFKPSLYHSVKNTVASKITEIAPIETGLNKTKIYKWKTADGELQLSNSPPPKGTKYIVEDVQHDVNVMPSEVLTGKQKN